MASLLVLEDDTCCRGSSCKFVEQGGSALSTSGIHDLHRQSIYPPGLKQWSLHAPEPPRAATAAGAAANTTVHMAAGAPSPPRRGTGMFIPVALRRAALEAGAGHGSGRRHGAACNAVRIPDQGACQGRQRTA
jgi:hypothetical protein